MYKLEATRMWPYMDVIIKTFKSSYLDNSKMVYSTKTKASNYLNS